MPEEETSTRDSFSPATGPSSALMLYDSTHVCILKTGQQSAVLYSMWCVCFDRGCGEGFHVIFMMYKGDGKQTVRGLCVSVRDIVLVEM